MSKTKNLMLGVIAGFASIGIAGCSNDVPPPPKNKDCNDWKWNSSDGVYECDEGSSRHYGSSYYGGRYYSNRDSLHKSSAFKSYKNSLSFEGSSGFGSGSKSFGG